MVRCIVESARENLVHGTSEEISDLLSRAPSRAAAQDVTHRIYGETLGLFEGANGSEANAKLRFYLVRMQLGGRRHMSVSRKKSHKRDMPSATRERQQDNPASGRSSSALGDRLRLAIGNRPAAQVAAQAGIAAQTLDGYLKGAMPSAERALLLADVLEVSVDWLISGRGDQERAPAVPAWLSDAAAHDWIAVPRYDLFAFADEGKLAKPEPLERYPIRRDWLAREARYTDKLWIADMPTGGMEDVAAEGEQLLCRDIDGEEINDRGVYIFLLGGRPIVRRAQLTIEGLVLRDSDPTTEPLRVAKHDLDSLEGLVPIGRVIGSIALRRA